MSEPLFELRYERTAEHTKEAYQFLYFKTPKAVAILGLSILLILWNFVKGIWVRDRFYLVFAVLALALLGSRIWSYYRTMRTYAQRERELIIDGSRETDLLIYDDRLLIRNSAGNAETALENFKRVYRTKHLIILQTKGRLMYLLPTDAFVKGTPEECVRFFESKGIEVS